jgi:hypothetical protein
MLFMKPKEECRCRRSICAGTTSLAIVMLSSCSDAIPPQGFGESFQNLYVTSPDSQTWRALDADVSRFDRILLEPLSFRRLPASWARRAGASALESARDGYEETMRSALTSSYPIVTEPAPGALKIETVLTDRPDVSELSPEKGPSSPPPGDGSRLGIELRFLDAGTGKLLAAQWTVADSIRIQSNLLRNEPPSAWRDVFLPIAVRVRMALDRARLMEAP